MAVSGLVITVADATPVARLRAELLRQLGPALELGEACGNRLPVVIETATQALGSAWVERLTAMPGVRHVDVVFVELDAPAVTRGEIPC